MRNFRNRQRYSRVGSPQQAARCQINKKWKRIGFVVISTDVYELPFKEHTPRTVVRVLATCGKSAQDLKSLIKRGKRIAQGLVRA